MGEDAGLCLAAGETLDWLLRGGRRLCSSRLLCDGGASGDVGSERLCGHVWDEGPRCGGLWVQGLWGYGGLCWGQGLGSWSVLVILAVGWESLIATLYIFSPITMLDFGVKHQPSGAFHLEGDLTCTYIEAGAGSWIFIKIVDFSPTVEVISWYNWVDGDWSIQWRWRGVHLSGRGPSVGVGGESERWACPRLLGGRSFGDEWQGKQILPWCHHGLVRGRG